MLKNISFCSCCHLEIDEARETQCMFFSFTVRAKKVLSEEFLYQITEGTPEEDLVNTGIPVKESDQSNGNKVFIKKLEENYYRIPTKYIDSFIRCLFKYLPAYYVSNDEDKKNYCSNM